MPLTKERVDCMSRDMEEMRLQTGFWGPDFMDIEAILKESKHFNGIVRAQLVLSMLSMMDPPTKDMDEAARDAWMQRKQAMLAPTLSHAFYLGYQLGLQSANELKDLELE